MKSRKLDSGTVVLSPEGYVIPDEVVQDLEKTVDAALSVEGAKVVVDCSKVSYLASSATGVLVRAFTVAQTLAQGLVVVAPPKTRARAILDITRLSGVIPVFDTLEEAEKSLHPNPT